MQGYVNPGKMQKAEMKAGGLRESRQLLRGSIRCYRINQSCVNASFYLRIQVKQDCCQNFKLPSIHHFEVLQETRLRWLSKCTVGLFWGTKHNALAHLDPISRATSKWQNAISRRGIVQLGASLGSIFFLFPVRVARVCAHNSRRKSSAPGS